MKAILGPRRSTCSGTRHRTYGKRPARTHAEVGDKTNDAIRVNGGDLRVKVVGEGGNLGLTQLAGWSRPQRRPHLHRLIDNSAGVDCSDHEVNIKILLGGAVNRR